MLRKKTAETLVRAPTRLWDLGFNELSEDGDEESQLGEANAHGDFGLLGQHFNGGNEDLVDDLTFEFYA